MSFIAENIKWVMLVSGVLTCTMLYAAVAPRAALRSVFGAGLEGPVFDIVVRNWGALIGLIGIMLIYGAFDPPGQPFIVAVAGASKIVFIALVLAYGGPAVRAKAAPALVLDAIFVGLFAWFLLAR